ncbi:MAG: prolyl oligopeptidase family serine peptidase [Chitinophagaceae bacterium]|nr:prolyl oligopeptidase family serine peptidase [Chitinophagaceae bacterium]
MKKILLLFFLTISIIVSNAQQKSEQFNIAVNYLLYLPQEYEKDTATKWPLLIFLHGSGERGDDLQKVKMHGPPKMIDQGKQFPFIVASPQAPMDGWEPEVLIRFVRGLQNKYRVDGERIYLTGLSMGGYGTWELAMKYPHMFAAIAPICGGGDTTEISKLKHMPVWCFHGAKDKVVKPEESIRLVKALQKYNQNVKLTIYPDAEHDSWTATYNNDSLYQWFLQYKKFRYPRRTLSDADLAEYAGNYVVNNMDTLNLIPKEGKLVLKNQPSVEIISFEKDGFVVEANNKELEIKAVRNKKGKVEKLVVYDEKPVELRKVN